MTERHVPGAPGSISSYQDKLHKARYRWAVGQLKNTKGTIIDIACGAGYGSQMLAEGSRCQVIGIDSSAEAIAGASAVYSAPNLSFRLGDAQRLEDIESGTVSAIVSFETIEHLSRPQLFLAEAARVLCKEGILLISTPNRRLASTLYPIRKRPNNPFHIFEYTTAGFKADVEQFFSLRQMNGQSFVPRWLAFWPIQVAAKAFCHAMRGFGAYRLIDAIYHNPRDLEVTAVEALPGHDPSIFVAFAVRTDEQG